MYINTRAQDNVFSLVAQAGKESACKAGGAGLIPGSGRFPGEGNSNPLQCSCLGNPLDRGALGDTDHGVAKSRTHLSVCVQEMIRLHMCASAHPHTSSSLN